MIKKFFQDSFFYTLANLFTKGIGFIMLPIYLLFLTKEDYGVFDYIFTVGTFLAVIVSLEIHQALMRFLSENLADKSKQIKIISTTVWFTFFCYLGLFLLSLLGSSWISNVFFGLSNKYALVSLVFITYFISASLYLATVILRSQLKSKSVTLLSASSAVFVAVITYFLLKFYRSDFVSLILGIALGQGIVVILSFVNLKEFIRFKIDKKILKSMLAFSSPLVFSSLGVVTATLFDRIMIKEMLDFESLGAYGVAARYSSIISLLIVGFQSALAPLIYSSLENPNLKKELKKLFYIYLIGFAVFMIFLFFAIEPLFKVLFDDTYVISAKLVPILALALGVQSAYLFFAGLSIAKKTKILAMINIVSAIINIILNFIFIPKFGVFGASYATLISAIMYFSLNFYFSEKYFPIFLKTNR